MAYKGWLTANIPIILGIEAPKILSELQPERVFCLKTLPLHLSELRQMRDKHLGGGTGDYANLPYIRKELNYASVLYKRHPKWTIIDVTKKPIEEIASEILLSIRKNKSIKE